MTVSVLKHILNNSFLKNITFGGACAHYDYEPNSTLLHDVLVKRNDDIERLDAADDPAAVAAELAPLFEGAPGFLRRLSAARPFGSWDGLVERAREIAHAMPEADQVELVDAHPRLGATPATVSAASFREQGYDRAAGSRDGASASARDLTHETLAARKPRA